MNVQEQFLSDPYQQKPAAHNNMVHRLVSTEQSELNFP